MSQRLLAVATCAVVLTGACDGDGGEAQSRVRTYYVAAEPVDWNYAPLGMDPVFDQPIPEPYGIQLVYPKLHYVQYTDDTFTTPVPPPPSAGILGPSLHATVGDTLKVVFFNKTDRPLSMHPHGVKYDAASEGAEYAPDGSARGIVAPGEKYTYTWLADENAGPKAGGASSRVWLYHSHVNADEEIYAGLIGTIVVTDPARARDDATPSDVDRELVTLFLVFNENTDATPEADQEGNLKHSINGRFFGNLDGLEMNRGEHVRWYVIDLGTEVDLHTPHWHGETVTTETGETTDVLELLPASMQTVDMVPDNPGTWLFHCHVADHMKAGMYTTFTVR